MKRLKPLNRKAELLEDAIEEGRTEEVYTMQTVVGCSTTLDPGWEVDPFGGRTCTAAPIRAGGRRRSRTR